MSLFGEEDDLGPPKSGSRGAQSSSLFDDGVGSGANRGGSSLFDDGDGGESPWSMPTPRKVSRGEMVRNLLGPSEVPESYVDAFDSMLDAGEGSGQKVTIDGAKKLFQGSRVSAGEQARLLQLVAPGGAEQDGLGRSEFNVLLALIALAQEGSSEDVTLDTVDERRQNLPAPLLPYLDKLSTKKVSETTTQPPPPEQAPVQREPSEPATPSKSQQIRRDSLTSPDADPWASPVARTRQAPVRQQEAAAPRNTTMSRPGQPTESSRTTSDITTNTIPEADDVPQLSTSAGSGGGWGGYDSAATGFANGEPSLLGSGAFGSATPAATAGLGTSTARAGGSSGAEEEVQITVLPEKEGVFMFQHRNYEVKSARRGSSVVRRYSDFVWLLDCLHKRYPFRQLALLPPKTLAVNGRHLSADAAFVEKRRRGLVRFINALLRHPVLREEQLVVMFLTVPTEIAVWRKQATISVQEEFVGRELPPGLEDSLPPGLQDTFDTVRAGVTRSAEAYIGLCSLLERLSKRKRGVAADSLRFSQALRGVAEDTAGTYAVDTNDVPLLNDGMRATAKHLEASHALLEDEARAWDEGVLEDLKRQRDCLVSLRDLFDRRDRLARNNIPQLERRIEANQAKLQQIRAKPESKPGEAEKVEQAIVNDKESIVQQHARGVFIKECVRDELLGFQNSQYHISKLHQDWSQERVKYAELQADNWRSLSDEVENMPTGPS